MNDYIFGNFVCSLRESKGYTQADLAQKLGVTPAAVSKWENGSAKPRVELLFKLSELLEVKPEELIAGRSFAGESLDPEAVKRINERYAYLTRIEHHDKPSVKLRRALAWIIDWNIVGMCVLTLTAIMFSIFSGTSEELSTLQFIILFITMLFYPIFFVLRDLLMNGRSIGKRIMGLIVIDKQTGEKAKVSQRLTRNLFLFILQIDAIVMFVTGTTIGDKVAHTVVIPKKAAVQPAEFPIQEINSYTGDQPTHKHRLIKSICMIAGIFIMFILLLLAIVSIALSVQKNTEEYKLAYSYLTESEAFAKTNAEPSEIIFNRYSSQSRLTTENGEPTQTATLGFIVKSQVFEVVCHKENDVWRLCEDCTLFE